MDLKKRFNYRKCVICGVRKSPKSNIFLGSFPLNPDQCRLWVKAAGDEDLVYLPIQKLHQLKYLCGGHFLPKCFNKNRTRLVQTAVPTERLTRPPLSDNILKEFPLYVHPCYGLKDKMPEVAIGNVQKEQNDTSTPTEKEISSSKDEVTILNANESHAGEDKFIPVPSKPKHPVHETLKSKCDDTQSQEEYFEVRNYKRKKKATLKIHDSETQNKRDKRLSKRQQNSKITSKLKSQSTLSMESNLGNITFSNFKWLNEPAQWKSNGTILTLKTDNKKDFWQGTWYNFYVNTGHVYGVDISEDFTMEVCVEADFETLYDQAGLMIYLDEKHWLKAGIEYNDGQPMIGSVFTNEVSDWATGIFNGNPRKFWIRLSKVGKVVCVKYSTDNKSWLLLRLAPFPLAGRYFVGPMSCTPQRGGLNVQFSGLKVTQPAKDILHSN